jgi:hypothetical protein
MLSLLTINHILNGGYEEDLFLFWFKAACSTVQLQTTKIFIH